MLSSIYKYAFWTSKVTRCTSVQQWPVRPRTKGRGEVGAPGPPCYPRLPRIFHAAIHLSQIRSPNAILYVQWKNVYLISTLIAIVASTPRAASIASSPGSLLRVAFPPTLSVVSLPGIWKHSPTAGFSKMHCNPNSSRF